MSQVQRLADLVWETEAVVELQATADPGGGTAWRGTVGIPDDDETRRLAVAEVELFDRSALSFTPGDPGRPPRGLELVDPGARFVYVETVRLLREGVVRPRPPQLPVTDPGGDDGPHP